MNAFLAIILVPLTVMVIGIYMAVNTKDPMWLVYAALLAIAAGYLARQTFGS
ncbi:MAG: hypothetical protein RIC14_14710 [Filomicrobium sp.]